MGGARRRLVETLRERGIRDLAVLRAFDLTPRVTLQGEYLRGRTEFDGFSSVTSNNASVGLLAQLLNVAEQDVSWHGLRRDLAHQHRRLRHEARAAARAR